MANLCLNSIYFLFHRLNLQQSKFINDSKSDKLFYLLTKSTKETYNLNRISDNMVQLEWKYKKAFVPCDNKTNIYLAIFTTCLARLKLYSVLDKLNKKVLHNDSDSVIYASKPEIYDWP